MTTHPRTLILVAPLLASCTGASSDLPRPEQRVVARHGVVAAAHPDAAAAGLAVLRAGGNAIDAAVATALALGVVEPMMAGVGGGGSMTIWLAESREAWNAEFYASAGADPDTVLDRVAESERQTMAARWVAVPGMVAGLLEAHERYGRLTRAEVLDPAIQLAREGFVIRPLLGRVILEERDKLLGDSAAAALFYPGGLPLGPGDRLVQPLLVQTLERIRDQGRDGFYRGPTAESLVTALRAGGNPMTLADMAAFQPRWRRPVCAAYRGYTVLAAAPPLSGIEVLEALALLERYDLPALGLPTESPAAFGALVDAIRIARADRDAWLGDPRDVGVPATAIVSPAYAASRANAMGLDEVPDSIEPGDPWKDPQPEPSAACQALGAFPPSALGSPVSGEPIARNGEGEDAETTHFSIVDDDGNAVAMTFTIGGYFGYGVYVAGAFMNDAMENFGGAEANRRGPYRTPRSTTAPTIVLEGDEVRLVVGSPGGARIAPAIVHTIVYALDYGIDPWAALAMPRAFPAYDSRTVQVEPGYDGEALAGLRRRGYELNARSPLDYYFGGVHLVLVKGGGTKIGAADPRRDGVAVGY
jgi:gamma-glutamyltranspeptidase/glutathione hydrolase